MTCVVTKLHSAVKDFPARGGASITEVAGKVIVFGGADREQTHFQDMLVYGGDAGSNFCSVKATGDVPMPRCGHAVVSYGKFMFLFGGIDVKEEAAFNDLYILDTDTFEWGYVGESGEEVIARNSHSLGIVSVGSNSYLALYGGASPEHGPLGDTMYALLPASEAIDMKSVYVKWELLGAAGKAGQVGKENTGVFTAVSAAAAAAVKTIDITNAAMSVAGLDDDDDAVTPSTPTLSVAASAPVPSNTTESFTIDQPGTREMHGTCCYNGSMYITGGRNGSGELLSDVWILSGCESGTGVSGAASSVLKWERRVDLRLPTPRCAHGAGVVIAVSPQPEQTTTETDGIIMPVGLPHITLVGGFTTSGISNEVVKICIDRVPTTASWCVLPLTSPIVGRFGVALCPVSLKFLKSISGNKKYAPVFSARAKETIAHIQSCHNKFNTSTSNSTETQTMTEHIAEISAKLVGNLQTTQTGLVLFGGVCMEEDFADLHLLLVQ